MKWYIVESYFGRVKYLLTKTKSILQPVRKVVNIRTYPTAICLERDKNFVAGNPKVQ